MELSRDSIGAQEGEVHQQSEITSSENKTTANPSLNSTPGKSSSCDVQGRSHFYVSFQCEMVLKGVILGVTPESGEDRDVAEKCFGVLDFVSKTALKVICCLKQLTNAFSMVGPLYETDFYWH